MLNITLKQMNRDIDGQIDRWKDIETKFMQRENSKKEREQEEGHHLL